MSSNQWILVTMTWAADKGLFLYLNGTDAVQTMVTTSVNNHDRSNRIMIGRSNAQEPANSFAEFTSRIFVLFDMFVTKSEATDIYVYYWGHGMFFYLFKSFCFAQMSVVLNRDWFTQDLVRTRVSIKEYNTKIMILQFQICLQKTSQNHRRLAPAK